MLKKMPGIKYLLFFTGMILYGKPGFAQGSCPPNIGFEDSSFAHWECSIGTVASDSAQHTVRFTLQPTNGPVSDRQTLYNRATSIGTDFYGNFPLNCPNGGNYSVRLGNDMAGRQAERLSYTFTVPQDKTDYSIVYNYAVVLQNPNHQPEQQPKFTVNIFDVTNNEYIRCSSFSYAASSHLPGFKKSPRSEDIFYKPWTPVTIKLSAFAGRTIRLEFSTNDCTLGGHFGYAYIDVNDDCSSAISGNVYCANQASLTLTAPYGYEYYQWFSNDYSTVLGKESILTISPPPPPNTSYAVQITPYDNTGCDDTIHITARFSGTPLNLQVPAAPIQGCVSTGADLTLPAITSGSTPGLKLLYYDSTQTDFLDNPKFVNNNGIYYIKATNSEGCTDTKQVSVFINPLPVFIPVALTALRPATVDLASSVSFITGLGFSYWEDAKATIILPHPGSVGNSGTYYIEGTDQNGCAAIEPVIVKIKEPPVEPPNVFSPNGDGINDQWEIPALRSLYPNCIVEIYTRAGQLIYRSVGYDKPWDGKYKGANLPVATYYYMIRPAPDLPPVGGSVTLVK